MKTIIYICISLVLGLSVMSCNDSFLDRQPQTEIGAGSYFNTEEDLKMYCYGLLDTPAYNYVADAGTDDQATTDNVEVKNIMTSTNPSSATITSGWSWQRLYNINFFLEHCKKANVPSDVLAHYAGIARYYRASFYMDKVKRYSDVPWYETTLAANDSALYKARDSRDYVVKKIFADFQYAADSVKTGQPKGAIDKWIVLATMARQALYEGTYRKYHSELNLQSSADTYLQMAEQAATEIMNSGTFKLYNTGHPESDYATLFNSLDLSTNPEMIQAHYYDKATAGNGFWAYMFGNYIPCPTKDLVQA
ncbi:MAG: RagB/SusD family nutrient uptake outer membrane protein, partial [Bacteroidales bacterium]|nr:RagB/SusD family nutrient uptake outer membrane protein [Bacteroidales bacterium]